MSASTSTQQTQSTGKKTNEVAYEDCEDWYMAYYDNNGNFEYATYMYTICVDVPGTEGGGSSGGGGGAPSPPPNCGVTNAVAKQAVNQLPPDDTDPDAPQPINPDPGYPDPSQGSVCGQPSQNDTTKKSPCDLNKQLSSSQAFKDKTNDMISRLGDDHESVYTYTDPSNPNSYALQEFPTNSLSGEINDTRQIAGAEHDHPVNALDQNGNPLKVYPTPSGEDVAALNTWYKNGQMINPTSFAQTVTTTAGVWTLQITNLDDFKAWAPNNISTQAQLNSFTTNFDAASYVYWNNDFKSDTDAHELALLDMLNGSGITLSRASLTNPTVFTVESTTGSNSSKTIVSTPCN